MRRDLPARLPALRKGPLTSSHLVRWAAAQQNWHKIHFDQVYAQTRAGLPERVIHGAMKQHLLVQFVEQAFPDAWLSDVAFRFTGVDLVGQSLEVRGQIIDERPSPCGGTQLRLALEVLNLDAGALTTRGSAIVQLQRQRQELAAPAADSDPLDQLGEGEALARRFGLALGAELEKVCSDYAIDPSRLRLFADAIGDLHPRYFDEAQARRLGFRGVVAAPLFPVHAIELRPGSRQLSADPGAMGREGVSELGRSVGERLGLPGEKMVNGGSVVRIHSLAVAGDTVAATSRLMGLALRPQARTGPLLCIETLVRYTTSAGRALLDERVTILYRGVAL